MADSLNAHFLTRKIHSLLGLVPVGAFLVFHLWENSQARFGAEHFNEHVVEGIAVALNYKVIVELTLACAILAHGIYGLVIWWQSKPNITQYHYGANYRYYLQRVTSLTTFAFIIWHVYHTRIMVELDEEVARDLFTHMQRLYADPWIIVLYVIGIVGATFHLANGLWLAGITWGVTTHPRAQRISAAACGAVFLLLTTIGFHSIYGFKYPYEGEDQPGHADVIGDPTASDLDQHRST